MVLRALSIYEFEGDGLVCEKLFFDGLSLQQQLLGQAEPGSVIAIL